jgi:hypothetical protein
VKNDERNQKQSMCEHSPQRGGISLKRAQSCCVRWDAMQSADGVHCMCFSLTFVPPSCPHLPLPLRAVPVAAHPSHLQPPRRWCTSRSRRFRSQRHPGRRDRAQRGSAVLPARPSSSTGRSCRHCAALALLLLCSADPATLVKRERRRERAAGENRSTRTLLTLAPPLNRSCCLLPPPTKPQPRWQCRAFAAGLSAKLQLQSHAEQQSSPSVKAVASTPHSPCLPQLPPMHRPHRHLLRHRKNSTCATSQ